MITEPAGRRAADHAAEQLSLIHILHLNPLLFAATNSSGGVLGKMISPQNIATGVSVTNLKGREGAVLARTFVHSVILTLLLVVIVLVQQYVVPGIIPSFAAGP